MFRSVTFSLVAAIGVISATQSALAGPYLQRVEVGRVAVNYGDLDLKTLGDAQSMLTRLQKAAYQACGGDPRLSQDYSLMGPKLERTYRECRSDAVSRAVAAVNAPLLTEIHKEQKDQRLARAAN
jgi:UrcA family protein